jgi:membrane protein DedA with SNARE-associated domain
VDWLSQFTAHAVHTVTAGNLQDQAALFLIGFLTEFGIPFPFMLDTVLFLTGYQIDDLWLRGILVVLILLAAREAGAGIVYWIFHSFGNPLVKWLGRRFPAIPGKLERFTARLGIKTTLALVISRLGAEIPLAASGLVFRSSLSIALSRLTPGLLTLTSVASGTLRFHYIYFAMGIGIESIFSDCTVIVIGIITGYGLRQLNFAPQGWLFIIGIIINIGVAFALQYFIWRKAGTSHQHESSQIQGK